LAHINQQLSAEGQSLGVVVHSFQSNHEGAIVDKIHESISNSVQFIVINAGAYTHTSIAIRDALAGTAIPFVEVHLSNVYAREPFRHHSYLSALAKGVICGFGAEGYRYALQFAVATLNQPT
jgi:3-dehydroquinate dehydratase II